MLTLICSNNTNLGDASLSGSIGQLQQDERTQIKRILAKKDDVQQNAFELGHGNKNSHQNPTTTPCINDALTFFWRRSWTLRIQRGFGNNL
jgi:hypothetical protein